jgi:hypothetical protein
MRITARMPNTRATTVTRKGEPTYTGPSMSMVDGRDGDGCQAEEDLKKN